MLVASCRPTRGRPGCQSVSPAAGRSAVGQLSLLLRHAVRVVLACRPRAGGALAGTSCPAGCGGRCRVPAFPPARRSLCSSKVLPSRRSALALGWGLGVKGCRAPAGGSSWAQVPGSEKKKCPWGLRRPSWPRAWYVLLDGTHIVTYVIVSWRGRLQMALAWGFRWARWVGSEPAQTLGWFTFVVHSVTFSSLCCSRPFRCAELRPAARRPGRRLPERSRWVLKTARAALSGSARMIVGCASADSDVTMEAERCNLERNACSLPAAALRSSRVWFCHPGPRQAGLVVGQTVSSGRRSGSARSAGQPVFASHLGGTRGYQVVIPAAALSCSACLGASLGWCARSCRAIRSSAGAKASSRLSLARPGAKSRQALVRGSPWAALCLPRWPACETGRSGVLLDGCDVVPLRVVAIRGQNRRPNWRSNLEGEPCGRP